jgi:hypothetical protein
MPFSQDARRRLWPDVVCREVKEEPQAGDTNGAQHPAIAACGRLN